MSLTYTGQSADTETGKRYRATGSNSGEMIIVDVSSEVLDDHGEDAAKRKGSDKYDNGDYEDDVVLVRSADFNK